jgi:hypothetical protein
MTGAAGDALEKQQWYERYCEMMPKGIISK